MAAKSAMSDRKNNWLHIFTLDVRSLAAFRVLMAAACLIDLFLVRFPHITGKGLFMNERQSIC